ncbi:MAG: ECF transporter S component [Clostridia bacterium]|nr:ECF transporter S component [Clostridia bacterium]MDR3645282.1 ECF transporter S component [Clostridia bacterium]
MSTQKSNRERTLFLTQFSMLLAIEAIVCFTPLGSIPIGPIVATLGAIPVIVAAIVLGTGAGTAMGFFFGLFSFIVWTFMPPNPVIAFVFTPAYIGGNFWSLVICFVPRILVGLVTGACFSLFSRLFNKHRGLSVLVYSLSGILGSLINTFLVLGGIFVFFGRAYAGAIGKTYELLLGLIGVTVLTNGLMEAALGGVVAYAVCFPLRKFLKRI